MEVLLQSRVAQPSSYNLSVERVRWDCRVLYDRRRSGLKAWTPVSDCAKSLRRSCQNQIRTNESRCPQCFRISPFRSPHSPNKLRAAAVLWACGRGGQWRARHPPAMQSLLRTLYARSPSIGRFVGNWARAPARSPWRAGTRRTILSTLEQKLAAPHQHAAAQSLADPRRRKGNSVIGMRSLPAGQHSQSGRAVAFVGRRSRPAQVTPDRFRRPPWPSADDPWRSALQAAQAAPPLTVKP